MVKCTHTVTLNRIPNAQHIMQTIVLTFTLSEDNDMGKLQGNW